MSAAGCGHHPRPVSRRPRGALQLSHAHPNPAIQPGAYVADAVDTVGGARRFSLSPPTAPPVGPTREKTAVPGAPSLAHCPGLLAKDSPLLAGALWAHTLGGGATRRVSFPSCWFLLAGGCRPGGRAAAVAAGPASLWYSAPCRGWRATFTCCTHVGGGGAAPAVGVLPCATLLPAARCRWCLPRGRGLCWTRSLTAPGSFLRLSSPHPPSVSPAPSHLPTSLHSSPPSPFTPSPRGPPLFPFRRFLLGHNGQAVFNDGSPLPNGSSTPPPPYPTAVGHPPRCLAKPVPRGSCGGV